MGRSFSCATGSSVSAIISPAALPCLAITFYNCPAKDFPQDLQSSIYDCTAMDVVASSITIGALAVNIANSVVKLKNCWDSIQDAPEDVQFLIERVELLSQILRDIEDDQTQNSVSSKLLDDSTASKCLKTCKAAADRLAQLTEQMATSIDTSRQLKRKWICAKVVLKKDKVLKFEKELQSCISLLQLSHETYTRSVRLTSIPYCLLWFYYY